MAKIEFPKEDQKLLIEKLQIYFHEELDREINQFEAGFLLDFFNQNIGAFYYNRGLNDALDVVRNKMDDIIDGVYQIEKQVTGRR